MASKMRDTGSDVAAGSISGTAATPILTDAICNLSRSDGETYRNAAQADGSLLRDGEMLEYRPSIAISIAAIVLGLAGCAATPGEVSQKEPIAATNSENSVALKGYDPVAYFTTHTARQGDDRYSYNWHGVTWKFISEENREKFIGSESHYAPQYGGYCAFAISRGLIADIDPNSWAVIDDKLYLNNNPFAQQLWNQDRTGNIAAGDRNWPLVPKEPMPSQ
jgi:hypothetical protein